MIRATLADLATVNALIDRDFPGCDLTELLSEPLHVCLIEGESGAMFANRGPGIYEMHVFYAVRGRAAVSLARKMIDMMRHEHGAQFLWTLIPLESRKVRMFARLVGWQSLGERKTRHGPCEMFVSEKNVCLQF